MIGIIWIGFSLLGCDHVIDKSKDDLWTIAKALSPKGYEVAFDANGIETLQKSYDHLAPGGRLIIYGMWLWNLSWIIKTLGKEWWRGGRSLNGQYAVWSLDSGSSNLGGPPRSFRGIRELDYLFQRNRGNFWDPGIRGNQGTSTIKGKFDKKIGNNRIY